MDIVEFFRKKCIAGIPMSKFKDIVLHNKGGHMRNIDLGRNNLYLDDESKVVHIGCISEYFTDNDKNKKIKIPKQKNMFHVCEDTKDKFGITVNGCDCNFCFRWCLEHNAHRYLKK